MNPAYRKSWWVNFKRAQVEGVQEVQDALPGHSFGGVEIQHYGDRFFAVFVDGNLLCVTVYKKGALAVKNLIETLMARVEEREDTPSQKPSEPYVHYASGTSNSFG